MIGQIRKMLRRLAWWREKDPLIVSMRVTDGSDNSPVEMVSAEWLDRQERINAAVAEVIRTSRAFAEAQERLGDAVRGKSVPG